MLLKKIIPAVIILTAGIICSGNIACAHGVSYEMLKDSPAVTFKSGFSSGEPISYGEVLIYAPGNDEVEFQNGRTDQNGVFSFLPDRPGTWKVEVEGGLGHKLSFDLNVAESNGKMNAEKAKKNPLQASKAIKVMLGISLIFNLCLAAFCLRKSKKVT
ncbi:hypothetical protein [Maridesulfovibrio sp.]|uniref:hypothetical protein n=1 Tax=Maridesulfovibrio sp. TaxID=2795000 RepID=UPI0039EE75AA